MNRQDWQDAFGEVPEDFHRQLCTTLDGLEEKEMKKRYKFSTMLVAALAAVVLMTGAAVAATQLGILDHLVKYPDPIEPLPGAEALVATDVGTTENELVKLTVQEAVYDGQGVMFEVRLQPKDPQDVLFDESLDDYDPDEYIIEKRPIRVPEGGMTGYFLEDGTWVEYETYEQDGVRYYKDGYIENVLGRKDGKRMVRYDLEFGIDGKELVESMPAAEWDAEAQPDGGVVVWMYANAGEPMPGREIEVRLWGETWVDEGEAVPLDEVAFKLAAGKDERRVKLEPVGDGNGERCRIIGGEILFTKIRGYMTVDYLYEPAEGETMGVVLDVLDADGNPIATGSGWEEYPETVDGMERCRAHWQIQSFDALPEVLHLQVRAIGETAPDTVLGEIACRLVEE